ncbi:hypothetical protein HK101_007209 [Irineochytrium annulatum]|nr:hypothetical protein HK101_007209 [Irineochytrium annulatum]
MSSSDYQNVVGGSLKLKGVAGVAKQKKDKKIKKKVDALLQQAGLTRVEDPSAGAGGEDNGDGAADGGGQPAGGSSSKSATTGRTMTPAEFKFEEIRRKRQKEKAAKMAEKSHKDRVAEFNNYLDKLSEHHDIPKVGPG